VPTGENGSAWPGLIFSVVNNEHLAERVPVPGDERVLQPHPRLPPEGCRRYGIITNGTISYVFHDFLLALELVPLLPKPIIAAPLLFLFVFRSCCGLGRDLLIVDGVSTNGS
jgi:hypothetical protein